MSVTVDDAEVAKFEAMAAEWWDPTGAFRPLHQMTPCRMAYVVDQISAQYGLSRHGRTPLAGLRIADVGCGGGLASEPLARLGATMTGFDAAEGNIRAAAAHAEMVGLSIDYRAEPAEAAAQRGEVFDAVVALEVIEHVADRRAFLTALRDIVKPGGVVVLSTLNRSAKSYAMAIVGAERIMRWLPVGTHDWAKFPTPAELEGEAADVGLQVVDSQGMVLNPARAEWQLSADDLSVNYILTAERPAE
ncbi:MAG: bifunctional 2-polyprenyl-6-hydroxyphenol methylase/3-demethylubiquinol 3-O-methyltransferase UbiG [Pikeienuella sp.]